MRPASNGILKSVPIYEYQCEQCQAKFSLLIGMVAAPDEEKCPKCGSHNIKRLVSKFRRLYSEDEKMQKLEDRLDMMGEPSSSQELRDLVREMGAASDDDCADDMEEMLETDLESSGNEE